MATLSYVAATVTLTAANTNYSLLDLLRAIETDCPATARELTIQAKGTNGNDIAVGDSKLSATRCGYEMSAGASRTYRSGFQNVMLGNLFVRSAGAGQKLNVEVMGA